MKFFRNFTVLTLSLMLMFSVIGCTEDDDDNNNNPNGPTPGTEIILSGVITQDTTLTADYTWVLDGAVFIGDDFTETVLTIEPGTYIYGMKSSIGTLIIRRNSKIMAEGTASEPIVFTSDQVSPNRSDWGGVIINGKATLNTGLEVPGEGGTGLYGGSDDHDNSGVMRYVRIEYAGREFSPDNELNGLALQGVGDGTTIEYIQVHMNKDDGIEFFGGTVNARYLYMTGIADDNFDWTDGWRGKGQFWVCQQYGDDCDQGIEADNSADENDATPRSHPQIYNITLVGDGRYGSEDSDVGMLLREGTAAEIKNAIVLDFGEAAIDIDHDATFINGWDAGSSSLNGNLVVDNSIFFDNEALTTGDTDTLFTALEFIETLNANNRFANPGLINAYDKSNPDYRPSGTSIALTGYAAPPNDGFFTPVDFVGGVDPNNNWLQGWTRGQ